MKIHVIGMRAATTIRGRVPLVGLCGREVVGLYTAPGTSVVRSLCPDCEGLMRSRASDATRPPEVSVPPTPPDTFRPSG
jgi:hypothetical protein